MNKVFVALLGPVLMSTLCAQEHWYAGADFFGAHNTFKTTVSGTIESQGQVSLRSSGFKLKLGYEYPGHIRLQGYYRFERFEESLYGDGNDKLYEAGVDLIKGFELHSKLILFVQMEIGFGRLPLDTGVYDSEYTHTFGYAFGGGVTYRLNRSVEMVAGIDFHGRRWQKVEAKPNPYYFKVSTGDRGARPYFGVNVPF